MNLISKASKSQSAMNEMENRIQLYIDFSKTAKKTVKVLVVDVIHIKVS